MKYGFGVDIGGTSIKIGYLNTEGLLKDKWEITTNTEKSGDSILRDISTSVNKYIETEGLNREEIIGIGLGVPGPVSDDGVVNKCVNLGWGVFNVEEELHRLTGFRVKAANDANVAALGEMWQGGGKGYKNVVVVTLGTGIGGGIIVGGKIVAGTNGAGGEIGHMTVSRTETEVCGCGKKGCLEQYASATGIVRLARRRLKTGTSESILRKMKEISAKDVFDCAKSGDRTALDVVEEAGEFLGRALANVACVCDPEIFVIGGGVSKAGSILTDVVRKYYVKYAFHASSNTPFALAVLDNDAGMYGCFRLLL